MKSVAQKSLGIFLLNTLVITAKAEGREVGFKSHQSLILLLIFRSQSSEAGQAAPPPPPPRVPLAAALSAPLLRLGSFQGWVVMKSSPSDVCSSEAAGRVGRAAEPAKASPLQTG